MGKGTDILKAVTKAFCEGLVEGAKAGVSGVPYEQVQAMKAEAQLGLKTEVTLDAEALKQLKSMFPTQLEKIFKGKKVRLADGPEVYKILSGFYPGQLEAIFGKDGDE